MSDKEDDLGVSNQTLPKTLGTPLSNTNVSQQANQLCFNQPEVSKIAWRAPVFWKADVELWFHQVESSFKTAGITSEHTKFHAVVSVLDAEILSYVRDLVIAPPSVDPYKTLKDRVCRQFAQSETTRLRTLLQDLFLGDRRPSRLLHEMKSLSGNQTSPDFLKTLWLQRLPVTVQQILSISSGSLDELALIADKISEVSEFRGDVAATHVADPGSNTSFGGNSSEFKKLKAQIETLQTSVERLSRSRDRDFHNRPRRRSRSASRGSARRGSSREKPYCWYHYKFKDQAKNCVQPCRYQTEN